MENTSNPIILNVDDYAPGLYARSRTLRRAGFDVREATNGQQALEIVHSVHPAVVILDVNLPDMSGITVCRQIKQDPATQGVIVLQTSATAIAAVDRARALEGGADSYLIEPAEPEELIANVRALLRLGKAELALGQLEKTWKTVLAATNDALFLVDEQLGISGANAKASDLYGYSEAEFMKMRLSDLRAPGTLATLREQLEESRTNGGIVYETEHVRKDGSIFPVEVSSKPFPVGQSIRYVHAVREISDRKRTEDNLRFLSESSKVLASSLDVQVTLASVARLAVPRIADWCVIDLLADDGQIKLVEVAHADPAKVKWARELRERMPIDPTGERGVGMVIRSGKPEFYPEITDEFLQQTARTPEQLSLARQVGYHAAMIVPLIAHEHTLGAITLVSAESRRCFAPVDLEMALELGRRGGIAIENARLYQESQSAIRTRDVFVSVASHELKTPVTVIQGYAELLKRLVDDALAAEKRTAGEHLQVERKTLVDRVMHIHSAAERLTRLLNDLLDVNRIQRGALELRLEQVELNALISDVVKTTQERERSLHDRPRVGIEYSARCEELWGTWDPNRIEQMVINLIDNAVKYSPRGGVVQVMLESQPPTEAGNGAQAHLLVRDEGIGIPQEEQARLFQPFMRAANATRLNLPGTGLGLAICREIVERHGGRIWMESGEGDHGTTFHVLLPTAADQVPE